MKLLTNQDRKLKLANVPLQAMKIGGDLSFLALSALLLIFLAGSARAQEPVRQRTDTLGRVTGTESRQQPGLGIAASKVYYSDNPFSISGFGEFNYVPIQDASRELGDLELYYAGLYRLSTFLGYRISNKLVWNSEFQFEFMHGQGEQQLELAMEAYFDLRLRKALNVRAGFFPLSIGYINNNDDPTMFYSVNRPEVERLIIPSTWIGLGAMAYGSLTDDLEYMLGITQGMDGNTMRSGSWIRQGRYIDFPLVNSYGINPQLIYRGFEKVELGSSAFLGSIRTRVPEQAGVSGNSPFTRLWTAYGLYQSGRFRALLLGALGNLSGSEQVFQASLSEGNGQVLGRQTYGFQFEVGYDLINDKKLSSKGIKNFPVFARYERLDTHAALSDALLSAPYFRNNLNIYTLGFNVNPWNNVVGKANYQYRTNRPQSGQTDNQHVLEFGVGFVY